MLVVVLMFFLSLFFPPCARLSTENRLSNLQGVVAKAGSVLSRLGIRDSVPGYDDNNSNASSTHTSSSTIPSMPNVDKTLLGNIQEYLRKLSEVDRSGDEYANEKIYRHDDQYLQYMVSTASCLNE